MSAAVFQNRRNYCSRKQKLPYFLMVYSNYAINISVIADSVVDASMKTLQFIPVSFLKIIFKHVMQTSMLFIPTGFVTAG